MKRRHEEISRESFERWISAHLPSEHVSWTEVSVPDEPPDWFLEIGPDRFAVEATSIVDVVQELGVEATSASVSAALHDLVTEVETVARDRGLLNGAYLVELAPLPNFRKHRKWLRDALLDYVESTAKLSEADPKEFGKVGNSDISIRKLPSDRAYIGEMISFGVKSGHEASIQLGELLATAVSEKSKLLSHLKADVILLILDSFGYSHIADWTSALAALSIPSLFHTICRVEPGKAASVLFSKQDSWRAPGGTSGVDA